MTQQLLRRLDVYEDEYAMHLVICNRTLFSFQ